MVGFLLAGIVLAITIHPNPFLQGLATPGRSQINFRMGWAVRGCATNCPSHTKKEMRPSTYEEGWSALESDSASGLVLDSASGLASDSVSDSASQSALGSQLATPLVSGLALLSSLVSASAGLAPGQRE